MENLILNKVSEQAYSNLFSEILLAQKDYAQVKPSTNSEKETELINEIKTYETLRGREFIYPFLGTGRGHGPFVELVDGSIKYDLITSMGVNLLGHSHPLLIKANLEAAMHDTHHTGNLLPYKAAQDLSAKIIESVKGSRLTHFWYACSGSFANDNALKMLWQKSNPRYGIIGLKNGFSGRTIGAANLTYNKDYAQGLPELFKVDYLELFPSCDENESITKTIFELESLVANKPNHFGCITMELVQGEGGINFGTTKYYKAICEWAKKNGLYIWIDEVQSFARTEKLWAFQMFELDQYVDIVTVGKALQNCGTLYTDELNPKPGLVAGTFCSSIGSILYGLKTLDLLMSGKFYGTEGRMNEIHQAFKKEFDVIAKETNGLIHSFAGVGVMISFQIGKSQKDQTNLFLKQLFKNGVIAFSAGKEPFKVRLLPPITLTNEHIIEVAKIIKETALSLK